MVSRLPALVDEVPEYSVRDGRVYIDIGGGLSLAMPVHVFQKGCAKGMRAIKEWQRCQCDAEIIPFRKAGQH